MKKNFAAVVIALAVIITAGCAETPSTSSPSSAPVESPTVSIPTPTPTETASAAPAAEAPAVASLTANDVYELCKTQTVPYVTYEGVSPSDLAYRPLSESRVEQVDGIWHALIGVSGTPSDPIHVFCSVSGTFAAPNWFGYGGALGDPDDAAWETLLAGVG